MEAKRVHDGGATRVTMEAKGVHDGLQQRPHCFHHDELRHNDHHDELRHNDQLSNDDELVHEWQHGDVHHPGLPIFPDPEFLTGDPPEIPILPADQDFLFLPDDPGIPILPVEISYFCPTRNFKNGAKTRVLRSSSNKPNRTRNALKVGFRRSPARAAPSGRGERSPMHAAASGAPCTLDGSGFQLRQPCGSGRAGESSD